MKQLKYCPNCGKQNLTWDALKKLYCKECEFTLYHNCAAAVAVVIKCGNEIMLTRRNQEPGKGKLDLAGGFCDPNENAETTCQRELLEELQLQITPQKLSYIMSLSNVYHYKGIDYNTLDLFYEYSVEAKFSVSLDQSEVSEILWIPKDKIELDNLAFESQKIFFKFYLNT